MASLEILCRRRPTNSVKLDNPVGINSLTAKSIIKYRKSPDDTSATSDDRHFNTVDELDKLSYVGPVC